MNILTTSAPAVKEIPILFSTPMVQAIYEGRKAMKAKKKKEGAR